MKYFLELTLLANIEIPLHFIWQKLFQQIHLALAENKQADGTSAIGVSFPEYNLNSCCLGTKLRLFAQTRENLIQLDCRKWLERLRDYIRISDIEMVPDHVNRYLIFHNTKNKGSSEKLARRRAKRKGETVEQALAAYSGYTPGILRLPYINIASQTTAQRFKLFIEQIIKDSAQEGVFSCYGLSRDSTVPDF